MFLLPDDRTCRTSKVRKKTLSPIFNENFVFQVSISLEGLELLPLVAPVGRKVQSQKSSAEIITARSRLGCS